MDRPKLEVADVFPPLRRSIPRTTWRVDVHRAAACHDGHRSVPDRRSWAGHLETGCVMIAVTSGTNAFNFLPRSPLPKMSVLGPGPLD